MRRQYDQDVVVARRARVAGGSASAQDHGIRSNVELQCFDDLGFVGCDPGFTKAHGGPPSASSETRLASAAAIVMATAAAPKTMSCTLINCRMSA